MSAFPTGLLFEDAVALIAGIATNHRLPIEKLATARTHGRVLAADIDAPINLPPFDNSAMDGFAFRHADLGVEALTEFRLVGEQFAGRALDLPVGRGECVRITTGAPLPAGG